jgi:hypothetical protein
MVLGFSQSNHAEFGYKLSGTQEYSTVFCILNCKTPLFGGQPHTKKFHRTILIFNTDSLRKKIETTQGNP